MISTAIFLMLALGQTADATAADNPAVPAAARRKTPSKPMTLDALVATALAGGLRNRISGPIAGLIDIPADTPIHLLQVEADQARDRMAHDFSVMVEVAPGTKEVKPIGLVLETMHEWPGNAESYKFRASLDGTIAKAVVIYGKRDAQNRAVKGSGTTAVQDINSPEIKKRFQHELDLWLKRIYLKKEWRSAEFSNGVLVKQGKDR